MLSETVSLTLNGLQQFFLENYVGRIKRNGHALAACGGYWERVRVSRANHVDGDLQSWEGGGGREGGREGGGMGGREEEGRKGGSERVREGGREGGSEKGRRD